MVTRSRIAHKIKWGIKSKTKGTRKPKIFGRGKEAYWNLRSNPKNTSQSLLKWEALPSKKMYKVGLLKGQPKYKQTLVIKKMSDAETIWPNLPSVGEFAKVTGTSLKASQGAANKAAKKLHTKLANKLDELNLYAKRFREAESKFERLKANSKTPMETKISALREMVYHEYDFSKHLDDALNLQETAGIVDSKFRSIVAVAEAGGVGYKAAKAARFAQAVQEAARPQARTMLEQKLRDLRKLEKAKDLGLISAGEQL